MNSQVTVSDPLQYSHTIESDENIQIVSRYMKGENLEKKNENAKVLLLLISNKNSNHPYHNSHHSYMVAEYAKRVFQAYIKTRPNIFHSDLFLFQLYLAERGHDVDHPGKNITQQDEENSASIVRNFLMEYISESGGLSEQICKAVDNLIINGTKFDGENPALKEKISQNVLLKIMQDSDILYLGDTYEIFINGSIRYAVEQMEGENFSEKKLKDKLQHTIGSFKDTILKRNMLNNSPFYMKESQELSPNFHENMKCLKEQLESRLGFGELVRQAKIIYERYYS